MNTLFCIRKKTVILSTIGIGIVLLILGVSTYLSGIKQGYKTRAEYSIPVPKTYIGGTPTTIDKWPFVVMITFDRKTKLMDGSYDFMRSRRCTGSIIGKHWILTAAHCVGNTNDPDVGVVVGIDNVHTTISSINKSQYLKPKRIIKHQDYEVTSIKNYGIMAHADLALIEVSVDLVRTSVPLTGSVDYKSTSAYGIGWGMFRDTNNALAIPEQLQELEVKPFKKGFEYALTDAAFGTFFNDKVLISYISNSQSIGPGDSGGPLVFLNAKTGQYELVGVTSSGSQFTDVTKYAGWIAKNMK